MKASAPLILGFNFLSTVILINLNKWVFARVHFGYPAALSNVHYVVNYGVLAALRSINPAWVPALEPTKAAPWRDANFVAMAVLLLQFVGAYTPRHIGLPFASFALPASFGSRRRRTDARRRSAATRRRRRTPSGGACGRVRAR